MSCVGEWCGDVFLGLWGHPSWNFNGKQKIKIITYHVLQSDLVWTHKWPFQGLSDLQLGDKKVTLNHLVSMFFSEGKHGFGIVSGLPIGPPHWTHISHISWFPRFFGASKRSSPLMTNDTVDGSEIPNNHLSPGMVLKPWDKLPYRLVQDFWTINSITVLPFFFQSSQEQACCESRQKILSQYQNESSFRLPAFFLVLRCKHV